MDVGNSIEEVLKVIAKNVVRFRKQLGFTQEDLAYKADIDRTYIGYIENAKQNVSTKKLVAIAEVLKVAISDLFKDEIESQITKVEEPNLTYGAVEVYNSVVPALRLLEQDAAVKGVNGLFRDDNFRIFQILLITSLSQMSDDNGVSVVDDKGVVYGVRTVDLLQMKNFVLHDRVTPQVLIEYRKRDWIFGVYRGVGVLELYRVLSKDLESIYLKWESQWKDGVKKELKNPKVPLRYVRAVGELLFEGDGSGRIERADLG